VIKIISLVMIKKLCVGLRAVNKKKKKKSIGEHVPCSTETRKSERE
jgi:hypothetical protein